MSKHHDAEPFIDNSEDGSEFLDDIRPRHLPTHHRHNEMNVSYYEKEHRKGFLPLQWAILLLAAAFTTGYLLPQGNDEKRIALRSPSNVANKEFDPSMSSDVATVENNEDDNKWPKIAWLMSFPNSGTSFTLATVSKSTQTRFAVNYGTTTSPSRPHDRPEAVHPDVDDYNGPFWMHTIESPDKDPIPPRYAITKTHCDGYCDRCAPSNYVMSPHNFLNGCASGHVTWTDEDGKHHRDETRYNPNRVSKAIHLIRSPLDNIVSRYHLVLDTFERNGDQEGLARYGRNETGFRLWCSEVDQRYRELENNSVHVDPDAIRTLENVPCHLDVFRYVQWHNLAFIVTNEMVKVPTMVLRYEDYQSDYNATLDGLLNFLELERVEKPMPFSKGHDYSTYFSRDELSAVAKAIKILSTPETWSHLQHYFSPEELVD